MIGVTYIPHTAVRLKWDASLRRHFIWFGVAIGGLLILFFGSPDGPGYLHILTGGV